MGRPAIEHTLRQYAAIVPFLAQILGEDSQVVLFDTSDLDRSVLAVANGELGGRRVGDPMPAALRRLLDAEDSAGRGVVTNHDDVRTGVSTQRSQTYVIRDAERAIMGLLHITTDIRRFLQARDVLNAFIRADPLTPELDAPSDGTSRARRGDARGAVNEHLAASALDPRLMSSADRAEFIATLERDGVFLLKGAVSEAAAALSVSEATIYRYLARLRRDARDGHEA